MVFFSSPLLGGFGSTRHCAKFLGFLVGGHLSGDKEVVDIINAFNEDLLLFMTQLPPGGPPSNNAVG